MAATDYSSQVMSNYSTLFGRDTPDTEGVNYWQAEAQKNNWTSSDLTKAMSDAGKGILNSAPKYTDYSSNYGSIGGTVGAQYNQSNGVATPISTATINPPPAAAPPPPPQQPVVTNTTTNDPVIKKSTTLGDGKTIVSNAGNNVKYTPEDLKTLAQQSFGGKLPANDPYKLSQIYDFAVANNLSSMDVGLAFGVMPEYVDHLIKQFGANPLTPHVYPQQIRPDGEEVSGGGLLNNAGITTNTGTGITNTGTTNTISTTGTTNTISTTPTITTNTTPITTTNTPIPNNEVQDTFSAITGKTAGDTELGHYSQVGDPNKLGSTIYNDAVNYLVNEQGLGMINPNDPKAEVAQVITNPATGKKEYYGTIKNTITTNNSGVSTYSPTYYDAVQNDVDPNSTVANQLNGLLDPDSEYMKNAKTRALQEMNSRGLLNSTMAIQAGQKAMMDAALPIAQQDASTYNSQYQLNQNLLNTANKDNSLLANQADQWNAGQLNDFSKMFAGFDHETGMQDSRLSSSEWIAALNAQTSKDNAALSSQTQKYIAELEDQLTRDMKDQDISFKLTDLEFGADQGTKLQLISDIGAILRDNNFDSTSKETMINSLISSATAENDFLMDLDGDGDIESGVGNGGLLSSISDHTNVDGNGLTKEQKDKGVIKLTPDGDEVTAKTTIEGNIRYQWKDKNGDLWWSFNEDLSDPFNYTASVAANAG